MARRRSGGWRPLYVEIFRGTSALVQLFWLFFVLPQFGVMIDAFAVAVLALGLNVGAYGSEVVRGAIKSVARGQWEASIALNMSRAQMLRRIILPQAFIAMIPPWGNLFIELLKSTALVSLITLSDLAFRAQQMNQTTLKTLPIFTLRPADLSRPVAGDHHRHAASRTARVAGLARGRAA